MTMRPEANEQLTIWALTYITYNEADRLGYY